MDATTFYAKPAAITDLGDVDPALVAGLTDDPADLCHISRGLIIHEFLAGAYGVHPDQQRSSDLEIRTAADLVAAIVDINGQPLHQTRPPDQRLFGNCRQFSVVTTALLRRAGTPARCRAGFANYFEPGRWTDHWIVEYWSDNESRWIQTDPQLDDTHRHILGIDFDSADLPVGRFLTGAEAWQACRTGSLDPELFGIQDMRGLWFIAGTVIRDLAALNKVETHTWDTWGAMNHMHGDLTFQQFRLVDTVADTVIDEDLDPLRDLYRHDGLTMTGTVTSQRTHTTVTLPT